VLVLALDTSTDAVVVGLVEILPAEIAPGDAVTVFAEQVCPGARRHSEQLMPALLDVCASAGRRPAELDAVVCGVGPGPFTGLRVGIASAAAFADALGVPAHGVCSLDAIAAADPDATGDAAEPLLVVTDARRREVYWAAYRGGRRTHGPGVDTPAALTERLPALGVGLVAGTLAHEFAESSGLSLHPARRPTAAGLVTAAAGALRAGALPDAAEPAPLEPMYLRRPDAVPPGARKRVTAG
jgi:tRNA threonylcarbamoyl adenosine modification protein YeaZ